jgi:hypothetical protein
MTLAMPIMLAAIVCLFFYGTAPQYWLLALPFLLVLAFMTTLAEIHDDGEKVHVKRWWNSRHVAKHDVTAIGPSFLDGIRVLQLRHYVFPWGRVYFVAEWSNLENGSVGVGEESASRETEPPSFIRTALESLLVAVSGFVAARAISLDVQDFRIETSAARVGALIIAATLCVLFAVVRTKKPSFANVVLFVATWIAGLVHS